MNASAEPLKLESSFNSVKKALLVLPGGSDGKIFGEAIQGVSKKAGVDLKIEQMDWPSYISRLQQKGVSFYRMSWASLWGHPVEFLELLTSSHPLNRSGWSSKIYDHWVREARTEEGASQRQALEKALQKVLIEEVIVVSLSDSKKRYLLNPAFSGFPSLPLNKFDFSTVKKIKGSLF